MENIRTFIDQLRSRTCGKVVVAVQGVQGAGKTFLCQKLAAEYDGEHLSLDDFYLPDVDLRVLYISTGDRAYSVRGNPGTHETSTLMNAIKDFKDGIARDVPVYDKYANQGRGDRVGWRAMRVHAQCLFVEGWCLGFASRGLDTHVDRAIRDGYESLYRYMDGMVILKCDDVKQVYDLRLKAERAAIAAGRSGMTDEETKRFVDVYMPAYETYLEQLYRSCPVTDHIITSSIMR